MFRITFIINIFWLYPALAEERCPQLKAPDEYCAPYRVNSPFKCDASVQKGDEACQRFYQEAINTVKLFCQYRTDAAELSKKSSSAAGKVDSALSSQDTAKYIYDLSRDLFSKYRRASQAQLVALGEAYRWSQNNLKSIGYQGKVSLFDEVHCTRDGRAGAPAGFELIGLVVIADAEQTNAYEKLHAALQKMYEGVVYREKKAADKSAAAADHADHLGDVPTIPSRGDGDPGKPVDEGKQPKSSFLDYILFGADGSLLGRLAKELQEWRVDVVKVTTVGIEGVLGYLGVPSFVSGPVVGWLGGLLQKQIDERDKRIAIRPYLAFAYQYIQGNTDADSGQIAKAYRPQKEKAPYCGECKVIGPTCDGYNKFNPKYQILPSN